MRLRLLRALGRFAFALLLVVLTRGSAEPLSAAMAVNSPAVPASLSARLGNSTGMFVEYGEQDSEKNYFQWRGHNASLYVAGEALWVTFLESQPEGSPAQIKERTPGALKTPEPNRPRKGTNLKLTFVGANPHPQLEPFNRLETRVSYIIGDDPSRWRADLPAWGGVRYKDLYPGIDLEITSAKGQLSQRFVARAGADLEAVALRIEGSNEISLDGSRLRLATPVGNFALPLFDVESAALLETAAPQIVGNQVIEPFASGGKSTDGVWSDITSGATDLVYSSFFGGLLGDAGGSISADAAGAAYVAGITDSSDLPVTAGAFDPTQNMRDIYVAKLNALGSSLVYATFLGGSSYDNLGGITVDSSGAVYITGQTDSSDFPTTPGAFDRTLSPIVGGVAQNDAFVTKLDGTGSSLVYSTYLGGNGIDGGSAIAVDASGVAYVTGSTRSSDFPTTAGAVDRTVNSDSVRYDGFLVKLDSTGSSILYGSYLGGQGDDYPAGIAIDNEGEAFIAGSTWSTDFPTTGGAYQRTNAGAWGSRDGFVTKFSADGSSLVYSTLVGGGGNDLIHGLVLGQTGAAYIVGETESYDFPTSSNAFSRVCGCGTNSDAFVAELNASGSGLVYSTFLGGTGNDLGTGIALDSSGRAFVTGWTNSSSFPTTAGAYDTAQNGSYDAFVSVLNADGSSLLYSTFIGGSTGDYGEAIALDSNNAVYVTGDTLSSDFPVTPGAFDASCGGCPTYTDTFISKLAIDGITTFTTSGHIVDESSNAISGVIISDGNGHTSTSDSIGNYLLTGLSAGNYALTASKSGYSFSPLSRSVTVPPNATGQDFTGTANSFSISGKVTDGYLSPLNGVTVSDNAGHSTTTNSLGGYVLTGLSIGTYIVTPSRGGYSFTPVSRLVNVLSDVSGQDFTASLLANSLSGRVTGVSSCIFGVSVSAGVGHTTTTLSDGTYTLPGLLAGTYTVTPSKNGCTFTPSSLPVVLPLHPVGNNFAGSLSPDFKQDAGAWAPTPIADKNCDSLSNIGCAVTSIADVLGYYGITINGLPADPGTVNQWLGNHEGFSDCSVRWDQLDQLTKSTIPNLSPWRAWSERQTAIANALAANELPIISVYPGPQMNDNQHLHFVVITGNAGTDSNPDYVINDPLSNAWASGNQSGKPLSQTIYGSVSNLLVRHYLQTVIIHRPGSGVPPRLSIYSRSPVQVLVTDPNGHQTGYNPATGTYVENIPGSTYDLEGGITNGVGTPIPNTVYFHVDNPANGAYKVQVIGVGTGSFALVYVGTTQSGAVTTRFESGDTRPGQAQATQVTYTTARGLVFPLFLPLVRK